MTLTGPSGLFACYLITSDTSTYIGFTPDPLQRLRKHNREIAGGARATRNKTWELQFFVYGFSTKVAALQFERQWQLPNKTKLTKIQTNLRSSKITEKCVQIVVQLLALDTWSRQPLRVVYVSYGAFQQFGSQLKGQFMTNFLIEKGQNIAANLIFHSPKVAKCQFCKQQVSDYNVVCHVCKKDFCMPCFAQILCIGNQIVPVKGRCLCGAEVEWKDILERKSQQMCSKRNNVTFGGWEASGEDEISQKSDERNGSFEALQANLALSMSALASPDLNVADFAPNPQQTPVLDKREKSDDLEIISID
eukprot:EST47093.1 GIY-YIG catalytic domain-containing protein [Spironucleus salmonicida]